MQPPPLGRHGFLMDAGDGNYVLRYRDGTAERDEGGNVVYFTCGHEGQRTDWASSSWVTPLSFLPVALKVTRRPQIRRDAARSPRSTSRRSTSRGRKATRSTPARPRPGGSAPLAAADAPPALARFQEAVAVAAEHGYEALGDGDGDAAARCFLAILDEVAAARAAGGGDRG